MNYTQTLREFIITNSGKIFDAMDDKITDFRSHLIKLYLEFKID